MTDHFQEKSLFFRDTRDNQEHDTKTRLSIPGPSPEELVAEIIPLKRNRPKTSWLGWISRNFKIFTLKPLNSLFRRKNHKNDDKGEFSDFTLYNFRDFSGNDHSCDGDFLENFSKSYTGWLRKDPWIHLSYHFCDFSWQLRLKLKIFEISRNSVKSCDFRGIVE